MNLNPYRAVDGRCRAAFEFWAKGFGVLINQFGTPWIFNAGLILVAIVDEGDITRTLKGA